MESNTFNVGASSNPSEVRKLQKNINNYIQKTFKRIDDMVKTPQQMKRVSLSYLTKPKPKKTLSCFLPGNYRVITRTLPGTSNLGQSCGKVHNCGKITAISAFYLLTLPYPTLPLY